ncbi:MAG: hypothetical protein F6K61_00920 [Sphaerospermopsis sp. SIO1G1]|nr:hypothetical protein [Sphaerospermopsis sp. SIO1G1]
MNKLNLLSKLGITGLVATSFSIFGGSASAQLSITPPPELYLDGQYIQTGNFTLTEVTGFSSNNTEIDLTALLENNPKSAIIGGNKTTTFLDSIPSELVSLNLVGFFDATDPDLQPANFDITLNNLPGDGSTGDFTYFLPLTTGPLQVRQITDLGSSTLLDDNINTFVTIISGDNIGRARGNSCGGPAITSRVQFHGGGGGSAPSRCVRVPENTSPQSLIFLAMLGAGFGLKKKIMKYNPITCNLSS